MQVAGKKITKYDIALLGIVLIGIFLRLYHLGTQSFWLDEAISVSISKLSLAQIVQADRHPPLYYWLLHYWMMVFGTSESAVRLLSALFGVLAIPMCYVVGRQLFDKEVGLVAALILAFSTFNVQYSQEARMYSLMVLLAFLSMYFFIRLARQSTLALSAGYVLSTTLLVYTHVYGLFVVIAQDIYLVTLLFLSKNRTYRLRHFAFLQASVAALFAPWMLSVLIPRTLQLENAGSNLAAPTIADLIYTFSTYAGTAVLLVLFLGLSVLSLFGYQKVRGSMDWKAPLKALEDYSWEARIQDAAPVYFLVVWLVAITLIPFIISRFSSPIYLERYAIAASVALYILVAKGINNINYRYARIAVVGIIIVLSVANLQGYYTSITKPQAREATSFIDAHLKNGDVVLVSPDYHSAVFNYYTNRTDAVIRPLRSWEIVDKPSYDSTTPSINRTEDKITEIQSDVNGHDRVWFFAANFSAGKAAENFTLTILNESYVSVYAKTFAAGRFGSTSYGYDVYLFEKRT